MKHHTVRYRFTAVLLVTTVALIGVAGSANQSPAFASTAQARTLDFSDAHVVRTAKELQTYLQSMRAEVCPSGSPTKGKKSFKAAIGQVRKLVNKAGAANVHKIDSGRDKKANVAEADATAAMIRNNPVAALALLLSAYTHDPKNATHLRNMGAVLAQISMPQAALAVFAEADRLKSKVQKPGGISETDSEWNNKGYALMQLRRWSDAESALSKAVAGSPLLSEARTNLSQVELCLNKPAKAATFLFAGSRRGPQKKFDQVDPYPYQTTQVPAREYLDVSHGKAGTVPQFKFPKNIDDINRDGTSFKTFTQDYLTKEQQDGQKAENLQSKLPPRSPASVQRVEDLEAAAYNAQMGGWSTYQTQAGKALGRESVLYTAVFAGQCGEACEEAVKLISAGGNQCGTMRSWLNGKTHAFYSDMTGWDSAYRKQWTTESRWATGVFANISNPKINQAEGYELDSAKQSELYLMSDYVGNWEQFSQQYEGGFCKDTLGSVTLPKDSMVKSEDCPSSLKEHSFSYSVGFFKVTVNCENINFTAQEPGFGPFARVAVHSSGAVTITAGAKAGVSMGPASAGVEAGVYVTVDSSGFKGAGVTANAKITASSNGVGLTVASSNFTASFTDVTNYASGLYN